MLTITKYPQTVISDPGSLLPEGDILTPWANPDNAKVADSIYSESNHNYTSGNTEWLKCSNFDFNLPADAIIAGILVEVCYAWPSGGYPLSDQYIQLFTTDYTGNNKKISGGIAYPIEVRSYGGSTDTWGLTLSSSDVNASTFGIGVCQYSSSRNPIQIARVDYVRMTIYYFADVTDTGIGTDEIATTADLGDIGDLGYGTDEVVVDTFPTGVMWDLEKLYFDGLGLLAHPSFDDGHSFDQPEYMNFDVEAEVDNEMIFVEYLDSDIDIEVDIDTEIDMAKFLDLLPYVPEKFHDSDLLVQYIEEVGLYAGTWLSAIENIREILNPWTVPEEYTDQLAKLIGLELVRSTDTSLAELRRQIVQAVDWYKKKGTYEALSIAAYLSKLSIRIRDMYTNDYVNFIEQDWFIGEEGENPPGLDASYFKSPHLGIGILLNRGYDLGLSSGAYLWHEALFTQFYTNIEKVRPVNVVPHYTLTLEPQCKEDGITETLYTCVYSKVMGMWEFSRKNFDSKAVAEIQNIAGDTLINDAGDVLISRYTTDMHFDDGEFFDYSRTSFLNSVTKWKLGNGQKGMNPDDSSVVDVASPVLTGTIDTIRILADRAEYEFIIPAATVQLGISELGLYLSDGTTIVAISLFPDIDKHLLAELKVTFKIYKQ